MGRGMKAGKKTKKVPSRDELAKAVKRELESDISELVAYHHNIDMLAVMFALHDEFKFGKSRILRAIKKACEHSDRMLRDAADIDEMLYILKDETGLTEEDMTWESQVEV